MPLLDELLRDTPASLKDWSDRIAVLRKAAPRDDLPASATELRRELSALARAGRVEEREGVWFPTYIVPVVAGTREQATLF